MVDDAEFIKRRHLSRGRPRKYEPGPGNMLSDNQLPTCSASQGAGYAGQSNSAQPEHGAMDNDENVKLQ